MELPVLQVEIQLAQFFQFAPLILVLLHLGLISQLVLLARETIELDRAIRLLETTERRTHPLRLELNNFFFVQAIAGHSAAAVMSAFLHGMSWLTLVILPVVLLLYIQVVFLPYHDVGITWTQRLLLRRRHRHPDLDRRVPGAHGDVVLPGLHQNVGAASVQLSFNGGAACRRRAVLFLRRDRSRAKRWIA